MATLKIKDRQGKIKLYEILEDSLCIGTSNESNIRVQDPEVAEIHVQIKRTRDGFKLIDLESRSGTQVNGRFVNHHDLESGDKIRVGSTLMKFEHQDTVVFEGSYARHRLARERGIFDSVPTWGVVSVVGGGALLCGVVLWVILSSSGPTYAQRQAQVVQRLADSHQFDEALRVIAQTREGRRVEPAIESLFQKIEQRIEQDRQSQAALSHTRDLQGSLQAVLDYAKVHGGDLSHKEDVLQRFQSWLDQHPDAPQHLLENLEANRRIAQTNFGVLERDAKRRDNW